MRKINKYSLLLEINKPFSGLLIIGFLLLLANMIISLVNPQVMQIFIDKVLIGKKYDLMQIIIVITIIIFVSTMLLDAFRTIIFTYVGENILIILRTKTHNLYLQSNRKSFDSNNNIMALILNELPLIVNVIFEYLFTIIIQSLSLILTIYIIFRKDTIIGGMTLILIPCTIILLKIFDPIIKNNHLAVLNDYSSINRKLQENIVNLKEIRYLKAFDFSKKRFESALKSYKISKTN